MPQQCRQERYGTITAEVAELKAVLAATIASNADLAARLHTLETRTASTTLALTPYPTAAPTAARTVAHTGALTPAPLPLCNFQVICKGAAGPSDGKSWISMGAADGGGGHTYNGNGIDHTFHSEMVL